MALQNVNLAPKQEEKKSEPVLPFNIKFVNTYVATILESKRRKKPTGPNKLIVRYLNNGCKHTAEIAGTLELDILYTICKSSEASIINLLISIARGSVSYQYLCSTIDEIKNQLVEIRKLSKTKNRSKTDNQTLDSLRCRIAAAKRAARKKLDIK